MDTTFHTLIYASARIDVDELAKVRTYLERLLGKEYAKRSDTDESCVNKIVNTLIISFCFSNIDHSKY